MYVGRKAHMNKRSAADRDPDGERMFVRRFVPYPNKSPYSFILVVVHRKPRFHDPNSKWFQAMKLPGKYFVLFAETHRDYKKVWLKIHDFWRPYLPIQTLLTIRQDCEQSLRR